MDHHEILSQENDSERLGLSTDSAYWKPESFKNETKETYYRITYRGVVALLRDPTHSLEDSDSGVDSFKQLQLLKSGAYLSYGEIVSTTHDILEMELPARTPNTNDLHSVRYRFIRVDHVLTGGYSMDAMTLKVNCDPNQPSYSIPRAETHSFDKTHDPADGLSTAESSDIENSTVASPVHPSSLSQQPLGYLLLSSSTISIDQNDAFMASIKISTCPHHPRVQDSAVVQIIPHRPFLCQVGTYFYKVTSPSPLPILVGPCEDAPTLTHAKVLPDTVQEISLRIGSVFDYGHHTQDSTPSNLDSSSSLEDGVVFLRLSHKKGWIADRRRVYSPLIGMKGHDRTDAQATTSLKYQMVAKDITHLIENIGLDGTGLDSFGHPTYSISDSTFSKGKHEMDGYCNNTWGQESQVDSSSSSSCVMSSLSTMSSMSTLSISTPLHVLKLRQRKRVAKVGGSDSAKLSSSGNNGASAINNIPLPIKSRSFGTSIPHLNQTSYDLQGDSRTSTSTRPIIAQSSDHSPSRVKPYVYLMRVTAPLGLKILDASHFQVNHLIRRPPSTSTASTFSGSSGSNLSSHGDNPINKKSPHLSSIFHTMTGGKKSSPAVPWEVDPITGKRYLPRGLTFEAAKRMEKSNNFVEAMGLIKLNDNTGWAIVPTREELLSQYASITGEKRGKSVLQDSLEKSFTTSDAFEEIGNAGVWTSREIENVSGSSTTVSECWLRIVHRDGVTVSCSPLHSRLNGPIDDGVRDIFQTLDEQRVNKNRDSDSQSSTGSLLGTKYLDKRSSSKTSGETPTSNKEVAIASDRTALTAAFKKSALHHIQRQLVDFKISCGMCVNVEPSHDSSMYKSKKYVRLCGGQGWIPQMLDGSICAVEVLKPKIRVGSFWFRVITKKGVVVKTCPYEQADTIKSDDAFFRFECGEFLRASEVISADIVDEYFQEDLRKDQGTMRHDRKTESFAKLYRRDEEQWKADQNRELVNLVSRGEWVCISHDDVIYLEEYVDAPVIQRRRDGWNYKVVHVTGEDIRHGPSFRADLSGSRVREGDVCVVNEIVTAPGDKVTWYRLKNGKGWINSHNNELEPVAVAIVSSLDLEDSSNLGSKSSEPSYGKIFGRLF